MTPKKSADQPKANGAQPDDEVIHKLSLPLEFSYRVTPSVDVSSKNGENVETWQVVPETVMFEPLDLHEPQVVENAGGHMILRGEDITLTIESVSRLAADTVATAFKYHE